MKAKKSKKISQKLNIDRNLKKKMRLHEGKEDAMYKKLQKENKKFERKIK